MKVDLLVSTYRHINSSSYTAITAMSNHTRSAGVDLACPALFGSALVHRARNMACRAIRPDADYAVFCDDDMLPEKDAILRLLELRLPVVSALTTTRELPPKLTAKIWDEKAERFCLIERMKEGKVIRGKIAAGLGFLMISKPTLDAAVEYHLAAQDWLAENRRRFDRMHVRTELREAERQRIEKFRRDRFAADHSHRLFDYAVQDDDNQMGEDIAFCWKLIQMGVETAVDTALVVAHVGDFPYSIYNMEHHKPSEVKL